jgi:hypothetical protein
MPMRPRFSLRLFLIFFTLVSVGLGAWTFFVTTRNHIRRHKEAVERLQRLGFFLPRADPIVEPTRYETLVRRWVDPDAFAPPSGALSTSQFFAVGDIDNERERYAAKDMEAILRTIQDIYNVPGIYLCVDRLTIKSCRSLARHPNLRSLYLDCLEIEPGATRELVRLRGLTILSMPSAVDDDAMKLFRNQTDLDGAVLNISRLSQNHAASLPKGLRNVVLKGGDGDMTTAFVKTLADQAQLTSLTLYDCKADRETAQGLAALPLLETLELDGGSTITADLWTNLARAKNLKKLDVSSDCRLIEPFDHLVAGGAKLEVLRLQPVDFGVDDLNAFAGHPTLKELRFRGEFSESQIGAFLRRTPKCSVGVYSLNAGEEDAEESRTTVATFYRLAQDELEIRGEPFR